MNRTHFGLIRHTHIRGQLILDVSRLDDIRETVHAESPDGLKHHAQWQSVCLCEIDILKASGQVFQCIFSTCILFKAFLLSFSPSSSKCITHSVKCGVRAVIVGYKF